MSQTKHEIQALLSSVNASPRYRFGQNFMIDQNLVRIVADAGEIGPDDLVIEVGPGTGTLTEELLARAGRVTAVEIDRDLAAMLRTRFGADAKFQLIEGDALAGKHKLNPELLSALMAGQRPASPCRQTITLVANLPYNIASPLVIELLIAGVDRLAFTVQKEVADRLRAAPSTDAYGPLTVMVQMLAQVELLRTLPPRRSGPHRKLIQHLCACVATIDSARPPLPSVDSSTRFSPPAARRFASRWRRRRLIRAFSIDLGSTRNSGLKIFRHSNSSRFFPISRRNRKRQNDAM